MGAGVGKLGFIANYLQGLGNRLSVKSEENAGGGGFGVVWGL